MPGSTDSTSRTTIGFGMANSNTKLFLRSYVEVSRRSIKHDAVE
jgi:hypothetical protein